MLEPGLADAGEGPVQSPPVASAALAITAFAAVAALVQFGFLEVTEDADTDFHVAVGRLIREHGLLREFPWTPFSLLAKQYADKELLLHLLFAPLADADPAWAANAVGTVLGTVVLTGAYAVLRMERVRHAWAWALVPLLASPVFVYRFSLVRPHLLSIALALVILWAASRERLVVLATAAAIYPWAYFAWQMPIVLAVFAEGARALAGRRPGWRAPAVAFGAVALGIALHPNSANLVRFNWVILADVLVRNAWGGRGGIELGDEFRAFTAREWLKLLVPPCLLLPAAAALAWRRRREASTALAFSLVALAFCTLTLRTARFAEYFVPFSVVALAITAGALRPRAAIAATLIACGAYSGREIATLLRDMSERPRRLTAEDAAAMQARIPPGAQVFTCEWGLTGTLMLALPERRFIVALDPTLFAVHDPDRYALWYRLPREGSPGMAKTIREVFGAQYVACFWDPRFRRFMNQLAFEPGVKTLLVSDFWNVYELGNP
jgi:hypothetical protein